MNNLNSSLLEKLLSFPKFGDGISFYRLSLLLEKLQCQDWITQFPAIKVTGSNGKGSTCTMISSILSAGGWKTGLFTSPHLFSFNERFCLNQQPISENSLNSCLTELLPAVEALKTEKFGGFELFVILAVLFFKKNQAEVGIVEAGIGGRFDCTRIFQGKVSVLTAIDLEHTELLGETLELIGYDKLDLVDPGAAMILGELPSSLASRFQAYGALRKINFHLISQEIQLMELSQKDPTSLVCSLKHADFEMQSLKLPLAGNFQAINIQTAILAVYTFLQKNNKWPGKEAFEKMVFQGLQQMVWEGRFQKIHSNPDIFIDVGHTKEAMRLLKETVESSLKDKKILLLLGVSKNKKKERVFPQILQVANEIVCSQAYHNGENTNNLEAFIREKAPKTTLHVYPILEEAVKFAMELANKKNMTILVAGSLFLSVETASILRGKSPKNLRFF